MTHRAVSIASSPAPAAVAWFPTQNLFFAEATRNSRNTTTQQSISRARIALLHSHTQRILFFLTEGSDAYQFGKKVVLHCYRRRGYFFRYGKRAAIRSKTFQRNALALHRSLPWGPHCRYLRCPAPAQCFLHGCRQRRRLENDGLRQYLESYLRRSAHRLRRRSRCCAVRSKYYLRRQWRRIAAPGSRHRRRNL